MQPTRVLVIRFSSIGDIVLTLPAVQALREALVGEVEIHFLTKAPFASLPELLGPMDRVHTIEKTTLEVTDELKALDFDYIVDLHQNLRSRRVRGQLGDAVAFALRKSNWAKLGLVRGWRKAPVPHIVERYVDVMAAFGASLPSGWPGAPSDPGKPARERTGLAVAVGAAHAGKAIPPDHVATVLNQFVQAGHGSVVLLGGPADRPTAQSILDGLNQEAAAATTDLVGATTLAESFEVVRRAEVVLAGDTGLMHLAAAARTPVIAVWGCTRPSLGMEAWRPAPGSANLLPTGRGERPCSKLGDRCRHGRDPGCTRHVHPDRIYQAIVHSLANHKSA